MALTAVARRRWPGLVVPAVCVAAVAAVALTEPSVIRGTLRSPRAVAVVAGIVLVTVAVSMLLGRLGVPAPLRVLAALVPLSVAGVVWIRPYYRDEVVDEAVPVMAVAPAPTTTAPAPGPPRAPTDAPTTTAPPPTVTTEPTEPTEPTVVARGSFRGAGGHDGQGVAALYDVGGGQVVVRLEDVDIEGTPGPFVHLVPGRDREALDGGVDLGGLTGNRGSSNYPVPAGTVVDPAAGWTVVVWCRPFAVPVAVATLEPVAPAATGR